MKASAVYIHATPVFSRQSITLSQGYLFMGIFISIGLHQAHLQPALCNVCNA